jgi:nucleoid-associated protein YgaU
MPLSPTSRYRATPVLHVVDAAGDSHPTLGIRPVPAHGEIAGLLHTVTAGETLESIASQYLGSSDAWWRIADANDIGYPFAPPPGTRVLVPALEGAAGGVERTRPF